MARRVDSSMMGTWRAFVTAQTQILERLSAELEDEVGLPLTWYEVLLILQDAEDGQLRMHQLADSLLLSRSAATRFIDRMEAAGLVERTQCLTDGRGTFVRLSASGRKRFSAAAPIHMRGIEAHFASHVSEDERRVIDEVMRRMMIGATEEAAAPVS